MRDAGAGGPHPAAVRHNRWCDVDLPSPDSFRPELPVSVVVPHYEQPGELALLLAALERQTYPRNLFEVVVVDDGSLPPLASPPPTPLDVRAVHQEDRGFGLARARNTGARAATHDILAFADADMLPGEGWLAAHARWHHAVEDALTFGLVTGVDTTGLGPEEIRKHRGPLRKLLAGRRKERSWPWPHLARTRDLLSGHDDLFRGISGNNFGIRRSFYERIGASDETFDRYGGEDTELAWRAQVQGALLVPARDALAWHQGLGGKDAGDKEVSRKMQWPKVADLVAHEIYRPPSPGTVFRVPKYVVSVAGDGNAVATVRGLLACRERDLVVRVGTGDRAAFGSDPRVRSGGEGSALDGFPASPFHVRVPTGADVPPGLVDGLRSLLGSAAAAESVLADGSRVSIARTWALHRARRAGGRVSDYGRTVRASPARLRRALRGGRRAGIAAMGRATGPGDALRRLRYEAAMVRTPRQALALFTWLAGAVRRKMSGSGGRR